MTNDQDHTVTRQGEGGPAPARSSRTFLKADGWYFKTREQVDIGPFATQDLAEAGVRDYAGFSMDADRIKADAAATVPDESGISGPASEGG